MDTTNPNLNRLDNPSLLDNPSDEQVVNRRVRPSKRKPKDAPDDVGCADALTRSERRRIDDEAGMMVAKPEPKVVSLDPEPEWADEPQVADQLSKDGMFKIDRRETRVFNLSDAEQLAKYNEVMTLCDKPNTNCVVMSEQTQFDTQHGVWSALVKLAWIKFKKILKEKKS